MSNLYRLLNGVQKALQATAQKSEETKQDTPKVKAGLFNIGDNVRNVNSNCIHYKSEGTVVDISALPDRMGDIVHYRTTNAGEYWNPGDILKKTESQLVRSGLMYQEERQPSLIMDGQDPQVTTMSDSDPNKLQEPVFVLDPIPYNKDMSEDEEEDQEPESETDDAEMSAMEEALIMAETSLKSSHESLMEILSKIEDPAISNNLTEPWLQSKIAIVEDYVHTIYTYVMYANKSDETEAATRPGLWENIRKKREKMGKKYRPAKPGDKDRPDPEQWKKLTK